MPDKTSIIPRDCPIPALLEFITSWVPDLAATHRVSQSLIPQFVPASLRAIYELVGNYPVPFAEQWRAPQWIPALFCAQDHLLPLDQLAVMEDRLTFIHENQGVWSCETLINAEDPPVFSDAISFDDSDEGMREVCPSLSLFLTTFCLHELVFGSRNLFCVDKELQGPDELIRGGLVPLWLEGLYAYKGGKYSIYLCERNLLIMSIGMECHSDYWIAYNREDASKLVVKSDEIRQIR